MFDQEEGLYRILEGAEFDVDEMMDSPSLIKDDGLQERTGVVKASKLNAFRTGGLATPEGSVRELRGGGPSQEPPLSVCIIIGELRGGQWSNPISFLL